MAFLRGGREAGGGASFWRALKQSYQFLRRPRVVDFEVSQRLGLRFYRSNSLVLFCSHLHVQFSTKVLVVWFLQSNWQNSHRLFLDEHMQRSIYQVSLLVCNISVPFLAYINMFSV